MDPQTLAATVVTTLSPYLAQAGEKAVAEVGKKLPDWAGKVWQVITARFQGKPAAEEAVKDVVAQPDDADNQAAFRKELRKAVETDVTFARELERLLNEARRAGGDTVSNTGSGAVATHGSVAAGAGGVAVKGDVHGSITLGVPENKE